MSFVLLIVAVRWWRFWRRLNQAPRRECPELEQQLAELAQQLGVKRVRLLVTESRIGPAVVGLFRKTILLPAVVVDRLASRSPVSLKSGNAQRPGDLPQSDSASGLRVGSDVLRVSEKLADSSLLPILAHELLHVRRGDLWVGMLQTITQAVWWFHPLVWWVGKATSREAERCCDEEVLAELNCDPATYARSLLDVLELKSQLAPVPVFPGVRPVEVTSKRLERIMTLRQGCRRRTPWWCWLIAIGAAALTLPGAAFVVSAQDESPRAEVPLNDEPESISALKADGSPGPIPPVPVSTLRDSELQAYQLSTADSTTTTVVYETADFDHLLTGTQDERQQKFERLVRSREQAREAQINWFDRKPIVKTTNAGHRAIQECVAALIGSEISPRSFEDFLSSVEKRPQEGVVIDLQFVTMNDDSYSKVEDAVIELADNEQGSHEFPLVVPAEKWDAIQEAIPHDEGWHYLAPRLAVFNGRTVHVESVAQHPPVTVRSESPYRTHDGLLGAPDWIGWKALALPAIHDDGASFWLGMRFEVNSLVEVQDGSTRSKESDFKIRHHKVGFDATLREGQVAVLPGLSLDHRVPGGRGNSTFFAVRISKIQPSPSESVSAIQPVSGVGAKSDAGFVSDLPIQSTAAQQATSPAVQLESSRLQFERPLGPATVNIEQRGDGTNSPKLIVKATNEAGGVVFSGTADVFSFRDRDGEISMTLSKPRLRVRTAGEDRLEAQELRLLAHSELNDIPKASIRLELEDASVWLNDTVPATSHLKADRISIVLNAETIDIEQIDGEGLKLLKTNAPVVSTSENEPEERSWGEVKQRRFQRRAERALNTSQALPSPYGNGISEKLSRKTDVTLRDTPLSDALQALAEQHGVNIVLDERGLAAESVSQQTKVSLEVRGIMLRSALNLILEPLSLGIRVEDDNVIVITSRKQLAEVPVVMAYPVADLVVPIPRRVVVHAEQADDDRVWKEVDRDEDVALATAIAAAYDFDQLTVLIQSTIGPDSWDVNGGPGKIAVNEATLSLVIRQTQQAHEEISDLFNQLRRLRDINVELQAESLSVDSAVLRKLGLETGFKPVGDSSGTKFLRLTATHAQQLRAAGRVVKLPKVTLFNGQTCELGLPGQGTLTRLGLQPTISADRRAVRLGIEVANSGAQLTGQLNTLPALPDGKITLLELPTSPDMATNTVAVPIPGRSKAFRAVPPPRRFVLIQPRVVIVEEEEELLGIQP